MKIEIKITNAEFETKAFKDTAHLIYKLLHRNGATVNLMGYGPREDQVYKPQVRSHLGEIDLIIQRTD